MAATPTYNVDLEDLAAAAREVIHGRGGDVIDIGELLEELSDQFGDRFSVSPEMYNVLDLIHRLWDDPHVDQVIGVECLDFAWNEEGYFPSADPVFP